MSARITFTGLTELKKALHNLPRHLASEASDIVMQSAESAGAEIKGSYPRKSGALARGVKVTKDDQSAFAAGALVKNSARHAYIWEHGSQLRHTESGASRGRMPEPPGRVFVPVVQRKRAAMYTKLIAMVEREGLVVRGG